MWDIPALLQSLVEMGRDLIKTHSPEETSKSLDNVERRDQYQEKAEREKFAARMRRFLSGIKILLILYASFYIIACAHINPQLSPTEREQYLQVLQENIALKEAILECLDHLDKCQ
jgi:hypothetical protein